MKAKSTNKFLSVALALFMLLMSVPFSMFATTASAEEANPNVHVFDSSTLTAQEDKGAFTDGQAVVYEGDNYFTLYMSSSTKLDKGTSSYTWDEEGVTLKGPRVNFGGKSSFGSSPKNVLAFTTSGAATVKVWYIFNKADRIMTIWDEAGEVVDKAQVEGAQDNKAATATLKITKAGKYFLGADPNNNYIFKVEVTETPAAKEYTLNADDITAGTYADKSEKAGTDEYFIINYGNKGKVVADTLQKDYPFPDDSKFTNNLNFDGKTDASNLAAGTRTIEFTAKDKGQVKLWWGTGNAGRGIKLVDETKADVDYTEQQAKGTYVSTLTFDKAGKYYLTCPDGTCYFYKVVVSEGEIAEVVRAPWDEVADPEIKTAVQTEGKGEIVVTVSAVVGADGGDNVSVKMLDKDGKEVDVKKSLAEKESHELKFTPSASGEYTFQATLSREGEEDKTSNEVKASFTLPLGTPTISSATSKGNGSIEVIWGEVDEATEYEVFVNGTSNGTTKTTTYMVEGLKVGEEYSITVAAKRGDETGKQSKAATVTTTQEAQMTWGYTMYGASVGDASYDSDGKPTGGNGYLGDLNKDGQVTVFSLGGKGKVVPTGLDGVSYYYTAVPSDQNFTLKAKFHVDNWTYSNGQDGFGLLAIDKLAPYKTQYWTNQYMLAVSKMEYWWDTEANKLDTNKLATSTKYTNVLGVGVNTKLGVTKDNVDELNSDATAAAKYGIAPGTQYPLDFTAATKGLDAGSYNIVGGVTNKDAMDKAGINALAETTDFVLELRKNNTGYFLTYYAADGKTIIGQQKFYDPKALSMVDEENVYVGFFAARNAQVTVSNVEFKTVDPKDDDPAEERPIEKIEPTVTVGSSTSVANSDKYTLLIKSNVAGTADVKLAGKTVATGLILSGENEYTEQVVTIAPGTNKIEVIFTPDKDQKLPEYTALSSTDPITTTLNVKYETYFANQKNLYVSPKGTKGGNGGKEYPLDIYTAVKVAQPGQTIILMEGTYELTSQVLIERGIDGTKDNMINMIADPEAKTRPVLDFKGTKSGMKVGGSYWYFQGFDVTNAGQKTPGMVISGNNNVVDNVNAYDNTDTGIFIKALKDSNDPKDYWPSNNLILNCTSHNNADAGMEDADGFACKLTSGSGNVFDGCIAYNNADDGWDLYAKTSTGEIGAVTIKNCVAYSNGILEDGTNAGNGNGFKMGGENLPGGHKIINSVSFNNKANGITCNSCPDISIENCTVFNNGSANVTVYSTAANTNFSIKGLISFRTEKTDIDDSLKPNGTQKVEDLYADDNYYWLNGASTNKSGAKVTADMFESLEFKGAIARNADNTINMEGFLALTETAPQDAGARMSGTPSKVFTVTADSELPPPTGFEVTLIVVVIAISAAVAIVLFKKRKSSK